MPSYAITTKTDTKSTVGPLVLSSETSIITIAGESADYVIEAYVDLSPMQAGDTTIVTEYLAVDGVNYQLYWQGTFSDVVGIPILRFHGKLLEKDMLYKLTINQTAGTGRTYPFASVLQIFNL